MAGLQIARTIVHVLAILVTLVSVGLVASAIMSSGWQIMTESGSGEVHQHGLWLDYNLVRPHVASSGHIDDHSRYQWVFNYKFGQAVKGDESHRAQPYQEITLILLSVGMIFAIIGCLISYCIGFKSFIGIGWAVFMFLATIISAAAVIQFFITANYPEHRFVHTDRKIEQVIGYSFWRAVVGTIGFALAMIMSVICVVLVILGNRYGVKTEKAPFTFRRGNNTQV